MPRILRRGSSLERGARVGACGAEDCEECQLTGAVAVDGAAGDRGEAGGAEAEDAARPFAGLLLSRLAGGAAAAPPSEEPGAPERERALRRTLLEGDDESGLERDGSEEGDEPGDEEAPFPGKAEYYAGASARRRSAPAPAERARCRGFAEAGDDSVRRRLVRATVFAVVFLVIEVVGGVMANSLALLTDAAHILSDAGGFVITLYALHVSRRRPTERYSFGFHRSETIAALANVLIIWACTAALVVEAVRRVRLREEVDGRLMTIVAGVGVLFNVAMLTVFHEFHGHGPAGCACGQAHHAAAAEKGKGPRGAPADPGPARAASLNIKSAVAHVVGDLVQSIGVLCAGVVIWINPAYRLADPVCTFVFAILVLMTTWPTLSEVFNIIMESTPASLSGIDEEIGALRGVADVYCVHAWSLTTGKVAMTAHVVVDEGVDLAGKLDEIQGMLRRKFNLEHTTIQLERADAVAAGPDAAADARV